MNLVTTCPHCQTTFKVTTEQLNAHEGDVRCGQCSQIFNAFEMLATLEDLQEEASSKPDNEPTRPAGPAMKPVPPSGGQPLSRVESTPQTALESPVPKDIATPQGAPMAAPAEPEEIVLAPLEEGPATLSPAPMGPITAMMREREQQADQEEEEESEVPAPKRRRIWLWTLGILVMLLALLAQGAYFFRVELAARVPALKPILTEACDLAGCRIGLPRNPDLWSIEASELQSIPDHPAVIVLNATLRNRAKYVQAYPSLELTLTGVSDQPVARRTFAPSEYLPADTSVENGMAGNGEVVVKLYLDTKDLKAVGYRLYLYYPSSSRH